MKPSAVVSLGLTACVVTTLAAATFAAATFAHTQPAIPIRELSPPDATAADRFANIFGVRQIANGSVLVNDGVRRQLIMLDAKLAKRAIVLDSVSESGQSYGARAFALIPYLADTTLFPDEGSGALVVIDPSGKVTRIASRPKASDMFFLSRSQSSVDAQGNLIYRSIYWSKITRTAGVRTAAPPPDSAPLIRANFETRTDDTIAAVKVPPGAGPSYTTDASGKRISTVVLKPLYTIDEWAMLSDGSLAMVRGHDYQR